jgi:hypothetical protein
MNHQVQVFEIDTATKPTEPLRPLEGFAVTADTLDEARSAATSRLTADGHAVRCISFLKDGGLAAVVYPPAPPPTKRDKPRRARNGGR